MAFNINLSNAEILVIASDGQTDLNPRCRGRRGCHPHLRCYSYWTSLLLHKLIPVEGSKNNQAHI